MKDAIEMGSGGTMHVPSFINMGSGVQNLFGGIYTHRHPHTQTASEFINPGLYLAYFLYFEKVNRGL
jgi:hypothetical protein